MTTPNQHVDDRTRRLARRVGASRVERVSDAQVLAPTQLLALAALISGRLTATGGRPSDPSLTVKRLVGFKPETWSRLQEAALKLSQAGGSVGPGQLAAFLIERSLEEVDENH